jgi:biotin carboxyl carrier protein
MGYVVTVNGHQHTLDLEANGHLRRVTLNSRTLTIDWRTIGRDQSAPGRPDDHIADQYSLLVGTASYTAYVRSLDEASGDERTGRKIEVVVHGRPYVVEVQDTRSQALASLAGAAHASGEAAIRAPMPGLVSNVLVTPGEEVQRGQTIVVLEAMKMENDLTTPRAGYVRALRVTKGQTVSQDDVLATIGDLKGSEAEDESDDTIS